MKILSHKYKGTSRGWSSKFVYLVKLQDSPVHYYAPQNPTSADLHIPPPTPFNGAPTTLPDFKIKLHNFFSGSPGLHDTTSKQLLYARNLMAGPAAVWYNSQVDPSTLHHPGTSLHFWPPLKRFWGGGLQPTPENVTSGICVKPAPSQIWR